MKFEAKKGDRDYSIELDPVSGSFTADDKQGNYEFTHDNGRYLLRMGTKLHLIDNVSYEGAVIEFSLDGNWHQVEVRDEQELLLDKLGFKTGAAAAEGLLKAPMPGKILDIMVEVGAEVEKDQPLVILEAMKMENELKAPVSGVVSSIDAEVGQSLEKNSPILEIDTVG